MLGFSVDAKAFEKRLKGAISAQIAKKIVTHQAIIIREQAVDLAPVDTGALKGSITFEPATDTGEGAVAKVIAPKKYAAFVEFGTGVRGAASATHQPQGTKLAYGNHPGQVAQPFMYPAIKLTKARRDAHTKKIIKESLS